MPGECLFSVTGVTFLLQTYCSVHLGTFPAPCSYVSPATVFCSTSHPLLFPCSSFYASPVLLLCPTTLPLMSLRPST